MPLALVGIALLLFSVNALIEGAITLSVLKAVERLGLTTFLADEDQRRSETRTSPPRWAMVVPALAAGAFVLAMCGVFITSLLPDGLEHLAHALQIPFGAHPLFQAQLRDYRVPALGANWLSRASAGIFGLLAIYCVCAVGGALLGRARRSYS